MGNQGAMSMTQNPAYHDRSKHIDIRYHFIRERIKDGTIHTEHVATEDMVADIMTKPLGRNKQIQFANVLTAMKYVTDLHSGGVENSARQYNKDVPERELPNTNKPLSDSEH